MNKSVISLQAILFKSGFCAAPKLRWLLAIGEFLTSSHSGQCQIDLLVRQ